jgi:5-methylcytosine-specific restriction protein A
MENTFSLEYLSPDDISATKRVRKSDDAGELVDSIRERGLLKPVMVARVGADSYVLIDGFRRLNACIALGITKIPCVVASGVKSSDIPVEASVYNHTQPYGGSELIDQIDYLVFDRGMKDYGKIEYLLQLNPGDVAKLQDIKTDSEILEKFLSGEVTISAAHKKLEARRKKEAKEESVRNTEHSQAFSEDGTFNGGKGKRFNSSDLDEDIASKSLSEMVAESDATAGFKPNKQKVGKRERIDPTIRKATLARDSYTCQCCKRGGESYVDSLDFHHVIPVALGGEDSVSNGITLCVLCHRLVHLFGNGQLALPASKAEDELTLLTAEERAIYDDDQLRFKRVVRLGQFIRDGCAKRGIDRKKARELYPADSVGRKKPSEGLNSLDSD